MAMATATATAIETATRMQPVEGLGIGLLEPAAGGQSVMKQRHGFRLGCGSFSVRDGAMAMEAETKTQEKSGGGGGGGVISVSDGWMQMRGNRCISLGSSHRRRVGVNNNKNNKNKETRQDSHNHNHNHRRRALGLWRLSRIVCRSQRGRYYGEMHGGLKNRQRQPQQRRRRGS